MSEGLCGSGQPTGADGFAPGWSGPDHCAGCHDTAERLIAQFDAAVAAGTFDEHGYTPADRRALERKEQTTMPQPNQAFTGLDERFERLPIEQVVASKTNPRQHFDNAYLAQLAESIRDKGVIQPVLVRPLDVLKAASKNGAHYEIIAGECRYRATKLAGVSHLPAVIRHYSDEQVLELQLIENIHRHDLTPLEQARGYRALIDSNPTKHSAESIAVRIGMSAAWVWDRMKLLDLVPEAKQLLEGDRISVGHAILIARLKPADQKRVVDPGDGRNGYNNSRDGLWQFDGGRLELDEAEDEKAEKTDKYHRLKPVSVRELDTWIKDHIRFDVEHAAKAQPLTFETTATTVQAATAQPGRGKKVISITHEYRVADDARDESERTYGSQSWLRADGKFKSKICEHSVLGVVVAGRGQGETFEVCVAREKCLVHFGAVIKQKERNSKLRESGKTKQADTNETKQRAKEQAAADERRRAEDAWRKIQPLVIADAIDQVKAAKALTPAQAKAIAEDVIQDGGGWQCAKRLTEKLGAKWYTRLPAALLILAVDNDFPDSFDEYVTRIAKPCGLNVKRLEAIRDKHQPKAEPVQTSGVKGTKAGKAKKAAA